MHLTGAALFVVEAGAPLTPALFEALLARDQPFALKSDYGGLPPPIEELDLLHLRPAAPEDCPRGTIVLRAHADGTFEFTRTPPRDGARAARVEAIERPGARVRLDALRWRVVGPMLAASPRFARAFTRARALGLRAFAPIPRAAFPLVLPSEAALIAGVQAKWAAPCEVERLVREAADGLEPWEKDLFDRHAAPGSRVLVVGCGAGRVTLALAGRFDVTGIDFVPASIAEARRLAADAGLTVRFEATTAEELANRGGAAFDAVLSVLPVYEQIPGRARRIAYLRALASLCATGGLIVLCAGWYRDRGPRRLVIDGIRASLRGLGVRGAAARGDRLLYHLSMISDYRTSCYLHGFQTPEEIEEEIAAAGLNAERHPEGVWLIRTAPRALRDADALLALVRADAPPLPHALAWDRLVALAETEGVAPLVYARVAALDVPDAVRARLRAGYERTWGRNTVLTAAWRDVAATLERAGLRALALKGIALLDGMYDDPGLRPMADIDVLVPAAEFAAAHAALVSAGWTEADGDAAANAYRGYAHLKRGGAVLDLHRDAAGYPRVAGVLRVDHEGLWRRAHRLPSGGFALSPEDQVLHLALHLVLGSEFGRLLNFVDVDRAIRRAGGALDWDALLARATAWRIRGVVTYVLRVAARALGTPVPSALAADVRPLVSRFVDTERPPSLEGRPGMAARYVAETLLMDRARWVARVTATTLFPPAAWLRFHYGARSAWQVSAARVAHPLRVCALAARALR
jgi:SAM-dependent methyltransferase